jgi:sugar/nucleoside kinase (ribokinase family)
MKYDVLSLGPARMDVFVRLPDVDVSQVCSIDRKRCVIELGFGEKIAVRGVEFAVGGNTGNNAVGLSRLGFKAAMVGAMGDGWTDQKALETLKNEGVGTKYIEIKQGQNGFGVVINYQEERTILSYYPDAMCCFPEDPELSAEWVYLTTMGTGYEQFYEQAVAWAGKNGAKLVFNPGTRQVKAKEALKYVYAQAEIVFVNREEATEILGLNPNPQTPNPKELLNGLRGWGAKTVLITDGPNGTYSFDGTKYLYMPIIDAPVVERTGAGDAFAVGFMGAVMSGKTIEEALKWGSCNSGSVLGFVGPQAGLLRKEQMEEWLKKAEGVKIEEV